MRLITGPLGSGKTTTLLRAFRAALPTGATLLTPTATMAEHVRNSLLREGLVFAPGAVTTLAKFATTLVPEARVVSTAALELITERTLNRTGAFASVAGFAGFRRALVSAIEELAAAGVRPADLQRCDVDEFQLMYAEVADAVRDRGWFFGSDRLRMAAKSVGSVPSKGSIFLDGFYLFTPGELAVVEALAANSEITATLPVWPGSERTISHLKRAGWTEESVAAYGPEPRRVLVEATNVHDEVNDIARRILDVRATGTPFREIGVVVRSEAEYVNALRGTFERFSIPARFYFASELRMHPTVRYLCGLVELVLADWNNALAADILRLPDSQVEASDFGDAFEAKLRAGEWGSGFDSIRAALPEKPGLRDAFASLNELRDVRLRASAWTKRIAALTALLAAPEIKDRVPHEAAILWRERGQALVAFERALEEAAVIAELDGALSLADFWNVFTTVIDNSDLRVNDHRRDVVHVIDAYEARQWNLPVVFVCGLLEGRFPKHHNEDPILPDAVRRKLQDAGFQVPTTSGRQRDEAFLFEAAASRASQQLLLSYPRANAKGDDNLRSFALDRYCGRFAVETAKTRRIAPEPVLKRLPARRAEIHDESLYPLLAQSAAVLGPTAIETYLQCPFQFFANRTLRLSPLAEKPAARMTPPVQGEVMHDAIELVCRTQQDRERALDFAFEEHTAKHHVPPSYRLEAIRLELLHNIRKFFADNKLNMDGSAELEFDVDIALDEFTRLRGRIDRIEFDPAGRPTVIDLKFKAPEKVRRDVVAHKAGRLVQGGLYLLAVQERFGSMPAGMLYCSIKKQIETKGWVADGRYRGTGNDCSEQELAAMMAASRQAAVDTLVQIRSGHIAPDPFDQEKCEYCAAIDVCRWEVQQPAVLAGGMA